MNLLSSKVRATRKKIDRRLYAHGCCRAAYVLKIIIFLLPLISIAACQETQAPVEFAHTATSSPAGLQEPELNPPDQQQIPSALEQKSQSTSSPLISTLPPTSQPTTNPFPDIVKQELPQGEISYALPLTIRHLAQDRAVMLFELVEPSSGYLLYQQSNPLQEEGAQALALEAGKTRHQVVLDGLIPGAEYLVAVALTNAQGVFTQPAFLDGAWGSVRVRTLSGQAPLRVGVFGDASFGDPSTEALMQRIAALELDFVIETGDVVAEIHENKDPVEAYALKFYRTLAPLLHRAPVYTVMGNHDYDAAARWQDSYYYYHAFPAFPDPLFPERQVADKNQFYAVAAGDIQFIFLDTQAIFGMGGREQQDAWIEERLADERFRYTIPVFHVPPFFSGAVHPDDQLPIRQSWQHLFNAARVPLVLSGHSHHYERLVADGITYLVSGGGSGITYAAGDILPQSQVYARKTHFVLLEIYPDRIEITAVDKDGEVIDQAVVALE